MRKNRIGIATFEYNSMCRREVRRWYAQVYHQLRINKQVNGLCTYDLDQIGTDTARNEAVRMAKEDGVDFLFMIDHDIEPDLNTNDKPKFFDIAMSMADQVGYPFMLGAPYCTAFDGKEERPVIFKYEDLLSDDADKNLILKSIPRGEAARKTGVEEVDTIGTGLTFFDMRCFDKISTPYFCYEYSDDRTSVITTEDIFLCIRLRAAGIPIYCTWDNWCGHWKDKRSGIPGALIGPKIKDKFLTLVAKDNQHGGTKSSA